MTQVPHTHDTQQAAKVKLSDRLAPKIRVTAFCETTETHAAVAATAADRRMLRANVGPNMGGIKSAILQYRSTPSPDLIVIEHQAPEERMLEELGQLAEVCDADTRVIVIGYSNDIRLYRKLIDHGISDYLVGPIDSPALISAILRLYEGNDSKKLGRTCAFIGAKGGVGSSTVAHNVAATLADQMKLDVILADMDLPFGTAGLDFNVDSAQGIAEALESGGKLDEQLFERLLDKCSERLNILMAPTTLDRHYDLNEEDFDALIDLARAGASHVVFDMPHLWSAWARRMLVSADEVVVTAVPDLANLRNTKSLVDILNKARPNDAPLKLILNQVGMSKRPEIKAAEFAEAVGLNPVVVIPFDPKLFGNASNNGQMIADVAAHAAAPFATISAAILESGGLRAQQSERRGFLSLLSGLSKRRKTA